MIRPLFTEIALFLAPFAIYAVFLWASRAKVFDLGRWSLGTLASLTVAALVLVVGSFVLLAQFSGAPPRSTYIPAHMENGVFVPARIE